MHHGQKTQVLEIKEKLDGRRHSFLCELLFRNSQRAVVIYRLERDYQVGEIDLPAGTLSLGYFWTDRNFNVYHWLSKSGATLGLYVNICDGTAIGCTQIYWRDLEVDLLIRPDARYTILDEDELPDSLSTTEQNLIKKTTEKVASSARALIREIEESTRQFWTVCP